MSERSAVLESEKRVGIIVFIYLFILIQFLSALSLRHPDIVAFRLPYVLLYLQEKQVLEKKVSDMEEEVKVSPHSLYIVLIHKLCFIHFMDVNSP